MSDRSLEESRVGQQIGNYRLIRRLGRGGFAEVYLGQHLYLPRQAAIKLLLNSSLTTAESKKFRSEARIVASLRHPHIVSIVDFGIDPASELPYLVMDYAPNGTLRQLHPRGSILPPSTILSYIHQIAAALDFAHRKNIVHRDVKPENMLLADWEDEQGSGRSSAGRAFSSMQVPNILLSDFGIAVLTVKQPEISMASEPEMAGTPYYMAPEQLRGKVVAASDQYALGIVVYEWLCGQVPFRGSFPRVAYQHLNVSPPPPSERNPSIAPELEDVVLRALSKSPGNRYASVSEFAAAFAEALRPSVPPSLASTIPPRTLRQPEPTGPTSRASDLTTQALHVQEVATLPVAPPSPDIERSRPVKRRALLIGLGGLAVAGGALWVRDRLGSGQTISTTNKPISTPIGGTSTPVPALTTILTYSKHKDAVNAVAWSPDGNYIVSGSGDSTIHLWDAKTAQTKFIQHPDSLPVLSVTWSPDTKYVVSGGAGGTVQGWDVVSGKSMFAYPDQNKIVTSIAWSPLGSRLVFACADDMVRVCTVPDRSIAFTYSTHFNYNYAVAWSSDGMFVASGSSGGTGDPALVWDIANGRKSASYGGHHGGVFAIAWSSDQKLIASGGDDRKVHMWKATTGERVRVCSGFRDVVHAIAWSPNGKYIAAGSQDGTVRIWDANTGIHLRTYAEHKGSVRSIAWSVDGERLASASVDKTVRIWQAI